MVAAMHCPTCKLAALVLGLATLLPCSASLGAPLDLGSGFDAGNAAPGTGQTAPFLQCVPYARQVTGIQLFGDAHTWWDQAAGRYRRGHEPRVGAVMSFHPYGSMVLGHVAAVSRVIDSRTVLLRHANWSPINGRRGQVEDDVRAVDVSPDNDWSEVRVWFAPANGLGTTHWPVAGFIYPARATAQPTARLAAARPAQILIPGQSHGLAPQGASSDPIGAIIAAYGNR